MHRSGTRNTRIIIIGAGIGGLAAASALRQRGYEAHVYERASALTEVGAGLQLGPNAVKVFKAQAAALVIKDSKANKESKEQMVYKAQLVFKVLKEQMVLKEHRVLLVMQIYQQMLQDFCMMTAAAYFLGATHIR